MRSIVLLFVLFFPFSPLAGEKYVGSKNSDKYHVESCQWAQKISEDNLVEFDGEDAASKAGYVPCKVCKPSNVSSSESTAVKKQTTSQTKTSGRCDATTKKGTQCKRTAQAGSRYCWQHQ